MSTLPPIDEKRLWQLKQSTLDILPKVFSRPNAEKNYSEAMTLQGKLGFIVVLLTRNRAAGTDLYTMESDSKTQNDATNMQPMCRKSFKVDSFESIQKDPKRHVFQNSGSHIHALGHLIGPTDGKLGHFRTGRLGQMHGHTTITNSTGRETVKPRAVSSPPANAVKCPQAAMKVLKESPDVKNRLSYLRTVFSSLVPHQ